MGKGKFYVIDKSGGSQDACVDCPRPKNSCWIRETIKAKHGVSSPLVVRCAGIVAGTGVMIKRTKRGNFAVDEAR